MYRFGFFFHLPANSRLNQELVLGFDNDRFRFYFIDNDIIPNTYHYSTDRYYELNICVLYSNLGEHVTDIIFLNDLNIEGLLRNNISPNPQIRILVGKSDESNDLINGTKSIFDNDRLTPKEITFGKLVLEKFVSGQYISKLKIDATYISASDLYIEHKWKGIIKK